MRLTSSVGASWLVASQTADISVIHSANLARERAIWELNHSMLFPGRAWGVEQMCDTVPAHDGVRMNDKGVLRARESRRAFARRQVQGVSLRRRRHGCRQGPAGREECGPLLEGAEIGACRMPVHLPAPWVNMTYVELPGSPSSIGGSCYDPSNVLDDARTLTKFGSGRFDVLIAAHVLEHIPDVLGVAPQGRGPSAFAVALPLNEAIEGQQSSLCTDRRFITGCACCVRVARSFSCCRIHATTSGKRARR